MKLNRNLSGTRLKPYTTQITHRQTTNFAAGIRDDNPLYFEDTREGGILAPPTFPVAVTWPMVSRLGEFIQSETFPTDLLITQVHYTEHLILHRPVRPGDRLTIEGEIAAILPHRAGTHDDHVVAGLEARVLEGADHAHPPQAALHVQERFLVLSGM